MEHYDRLGIIAYEVGEEVVDAPRWAHDEEYDITLNAPVIDAGGGNWYSLPMAPTDAIELASDCEDYAAAAEVPLSAEEVAELTSALQGDDTRSLHEAFGR